METNVFHASEETLAELDRLKKHFGVKTATEVLRCSLALARKTKEGLLLLQLGVDPAANDNA